jgi:hypothetical protein
MMKVKFGRIVVCGFIWDYLIVELLLAVLLVLNEYLGFIE